MIKKPTRTKSKWENRFSKVKRWSFVKYDWDDRYIKEFFFDWFIRIENNDWINRHVQSLDDEFLDQQKFLLDYNDKWK